MNERIKEFAEEAKKYAINRLDETGELHKYYDVYFEKFAELIEQHTIERLKNKKNSMYTDIVSDGGMDPRS